jgi:hypothetical protein
LFAVACGKKQETSSEQPAAPPPRPVADAAPPVAVPKTPPPIPEPQNYTVVKPAFGGTVPKFPQLSRDGASAAIEISEPVEVTSPMTTYEVGFLSDTGKLERVAVLDSATVAKLAADPATKVDKVAAEKSASTIAKRLADGGFSDFASAIDQGALQDVGTAARNKGEELPVSIDKAKLVATVVVNKSGPTSLRLRLDSADGKKLTEQLVPAVVGSSSHACGAAPRLGGVWFDTGRKRMLLQIAFTTAGCFVPPTYQLWKLP